MFIYATTKANSSNPIAIEGHRVYRDKDGAEYSKRAEIALRLLKTDAVVEKSNFWGYKSGQYVACQYITKTKDFAGRNLPITICMKRNDRFDMTAIHTLWEERYSLSVVELNEIQKCLETEVALECPPPLCAALAALAFMGVQFASSLISKYVDYGLKTAYNFCVSKTGGHSACELIAH